MLKLSRIPLFKIEGYGVYPPSLLALKLLWLLMIAQHTMDKFNIPFLPMLPFLDILLPFQTEISITSQALFGGAGLCLLFNIKPRMAAMLIGGLILFALLGNRTNYRNHFFLIGCIFFLVACHNEDEWPWLLLVQLAFMYIAAGLNKIWEPDWRSGQFMETWLGHSFGWYQFFADKMPPQSFGALLCWATIMIEVIMGILLLIPRWMQLTIWIIAGFHFFLYIVTGGNVFGYFLHGIIILILALLPWPKERAQLQINSKLYPICKLLVLGLDHNKKFSLSECHGRSKLTLNANLVFYGLGAMRSFLLRIPVFHYSLLFTMLVLPRYTSSAFAYWTTSTLFILIWVSTFPYESLPWKTNHPKYELNN